MVERFYRAVDEKQGDTACAQLSEETRKALRDEAKSPCRQAIVEPDLEFEGERVRQVEVSQTAAEVTFVGGERAFLDKGPGGWRISAAGCRPPAAPKEPYDCEVES